MISQSVEKLEFVLRGVACLAWGFSAAPGAASTIRRGGYQ